MLRIVYAACLLGATCTHLVMHGKFGVLLGGLKDAGHPLITRFYWSSLTLLDPAAAALLLVHPRGGLVLTSAIIVSDVAHNSWVLHCFEQPTNVFYWCHFMFLVLVLSTFRLCWRGLEEMPIYK